jgi:hypothetical protein
VYQGNRDSRIGMTVGNFAEEWLIRPASIWRKSFHPSISSEEDFSSNLNPMGNVDSTGIPILDITKKFHLYSIPDSNPTKNLYSIPDTNPTVLEPDGCSIIFTNLAYSRSLWGQARPVAQG